MRAILSIAVLACIAGAVQAQQPQQQPATQQPIPLPAPARQPPPAGQWTPQQIQEAFRQADQNGDGVLTRAEAQRLPIMPLSFEDMDTNKDGVLDINEYLNAFQPQR